MRERPILFSGPMVRALLAGTKTQTRRVVKPHPSDDIAGECGARCPHGEPGDRLWVREAYRMLFEYDLTAPSAVSKGYPVRYEADGLSREDEDGGWVWGKLRPSMFMPRWASRLMLEIVDVKVERLHEISTADAIAEGVTELPGQDGEPGAWWSGDIDRGQQLHARTPEAAYRLLWEAINGSGSWAINPWVYVIEFKRSQT